MKKVENRKSPAFSESHANAALNFFELVLKRRDHRPFLLSPQQQDTVRGIFGYPEILEAKLVEVLSTEVLKAGSRDFTAGLVLLVLTLYPKGRAAKVYRAAGRMIKQSLILKREFHV